MIFPPLLLSNIIVASGGEASKIESRVYDMFSCDACMTVMSGLRSDLKFLIESEKKWTRKVLNKRISVSCEDPRLTVGDQAKATCLLFVSDYKKRIAKLMEARWEQDSDEYEEDIHPRSVCENELKSCKEGQQTIAEILNKDETVQKLDAERRPKEEEL